MTQLILNHVSAYFPIPILDGPSRTDAVRKSAPIKNKLHHLFAPKKIILAGGINPYVLPNFGKNITT
ncbi:MAG: hypothetical protein B7Z82_05885 [Halothiobacillus sp. 20-54-6]|nr:MAG: hypothetical protein B7Z82_05885 [Halothiobacillus sp. 20-54-6]